MPRSSRLAHRPEPSTYVRSMAPTRSSLLDELEAENLKLRETLAELTLRTAMLREALQHDSAPTIDGHKRQ